MTSEVKFFVSVGVITLLILVGGVFLYSNKASENVKPVEESILVKEDSTKMVSASASATFVEFGDMQCPACAVAHPTTKQIRENYAGKINFVFRHFPLLQHKNAQIGAKAIEAAGEQGKFWEMQDIMYDKQDEWGEKDKPLDIFMGYAKELNLDEAKFKSSVDSNKFKDKIDGDTYDGNQAGVDATPTFFINGIKYTGSYSYDDVKKALDDAMRKK
ncbi:hypothetical protein A3D77_05490 [Candidatus Gottesmanbacteria bacterium RIFCSPHIGHO2_02_FULL_39_11]|uniref:Thioredoxin domain-containing protein n=1 Tax=Candidatus Gottesmanbacteria bacterium RIFCSPHIGHO2_02_FULL_39_11 TaxID=1798382 RepID=A0A1F5ZLB5_9BACT|nr:MAG: hypothetical protein A3D77_05490 [Candidatus Gottesmanbacteria bacterium RIFCSPHIGHO2_02_FULL_39_11]